MCSQKQACQNNNVQNDRPAWVPSQVKVKSINLNVTAAYLCLPVYLVFRLLNFSLSF